MSNNLEEISLSKLVLEGSHPENSKVITTGPEEEDQRDLIYGIEDCPPWYSCILLSLQQLVTIFGGCLTYTFLVSSLLCVAEDDPMRMKLFATSILVSGFATILQTTIGIRLPIIQGSSFSFMVPVIVILKTDFAPCADFNMSNMTRADQNQISYDRMRELQGCIIVASLFQILVGITGLVGFCISYISPLVVSATITSLGFAITEVAAEGASTDWRISGLTILLVLITSQILSEAKVPFPKYSKSRGFGVVKFPFFKSFSVLLSMAISWIVCGIMTCTGAIPIDSPSRTDKQMAIVSNSPWLYFPYPLQWGTPTLSIGGVFGIVSGVIVSIIESVGDYFACARISGSDIYCVDSIYFYP